MTPEYPSRRQPLSAPELFTSIPLEDRKNEFPITTSESNTHRCKRHTAIIVIALLLSFILDQNIIATAVPSITHDFRTIRDIGWYSSIYRLTYSAFQPLFGKIYSLFPHRRVHLVSVSLFTCGALLCGLAPTSAIFIIGRALTGYAAAGVIAGAFSLITHSFSLQKRSIYAGLGGGAEAAAAAIAPVLGGVLADHLTWRWCFFLQLPLVALTFGAICAVQKTARLPTRPLREKLSALDILGTTTFAGSVTSLLLATQLGAGKYEWSDWRIILLFILVAPLLLAFLYIQHRRQERAILPPRIVVSRNILFGVLFSAANNGALAIIEYYMPLYLQNSRSMTATMSGVMLLPIVIGLLVSVTLAGSLTSIVGYSNPFMITTSILTPVATGLLTTIDQTTSIWKLVIFQSLLGIGVGVGFQGPQVVVQAVLSKQDTPIGIGIIQFAQGIGPAIFTAASQSILLAQFRKGLERAGLTSDEIRMASSGTDPLDLPIEEATKLAVSRAYTRSLTETFCLPVALSCLTAVGALGVDWCSVRYQNLSA